MMVLNGIRLRIYPSKEQQLRIKLNFGYNRFVWNQMLNMLKEQYKNNPELSFPSAFTINYLLPILVLESKESRDFFGTTRWIFTKPTKNSFII